MSYNSADQAEETDTGIVGDGWDNFLFDQDLEALRDYAKILKKIRATACLSVIQELIAWVDSEPGKPPIEVASNDKPETRVRLDALWEAYVKASREEDPVGRARKKFPKEKNKYPITDREFYDFFGPENADSNCRKELCMRGSIRNGVFCRTHHFESIFRKPCPWTD